MPASGTWLRALIVYSLDIACMMRINGWSKGIKLLRRPKNPGR
jgi:hypothetical protein